MKIFDEGIFLSHLELEVAKSERFGYPFSILAIKALDAYINTVMLLNSILEANYRKTDLVARLTDGTYVILLNGTNENKAQQYLSRLIQTAVSENNIAVIAGITNYQDSDDAKKIMNRLLEKIK
ncbi:hypothetical protein AAGG74_17435 [Bacillus mexicanus]|uniref:hypothetical protein n=1 Tax=Bacillus mexicanus TaxID=2834415 RepID=UPI003D1B1BEA